VGVVPHLHALGIICVVWSELEESLSRLYTNLLFGLESLAYEDYFTFRDLKRRRGKVLAAAKAKLPDNLHEDLQKLYEDIERDAALRNEVVHGVWGAYPGRTKFALIYNPKDVADKMNDLFSGMVKMKRNPQKVPTFSVDILPEHYRAWKQQDFQGLINRIQALTARANELANASLTHAIGVWMQSEKQHE
jgi:hypothetical protein